MTRHVLVLSLLAFACEKPPVLTAADRSEVYQANVVGAQALCTAMLMDKEVPHTQALEDWCVLVLQGRDGCGAQ